jgi:hypothetical protein
MLYLCYIILYPFEAISACTEKVFWFYLVTAGQIMDGTCMCPTTFPSDISFHTIHVRTPVTFADRLCKLCS